jgi:hypothetical protein
MAVLDDKSRQKRVWDFELSAGNAHFSGVVDAVGTNEAIDWAIKAVVCYGITADQVTKVDAKPRDN